MVALARLEWIIVSIVGTFFVGGHLLLLVWWEERNTQLSRAAEDDKTRTNDRIISALKKVRQANEAGHAAEQERIRKNPVVLRLHPETAEKPTRQAFTVVGGEARPGGNRLLNAREADDPSMRQAIDDILNSRDEPKIRRPLADLETPSVDRCACLLQRLPAEQRSAKQVEGKLDVLFKGASGFWAGGQEEARHLASAASEAGGPAAPCAEATYGEIRVDGLQLVLSTLAASLGRSEASASNLEAVSPAFDVFIDLGAGVGRTAAAAVLLGVARQAMGVELGPQRFAMGCKAMAQEGKSFPGPTFVATDAEATRLELLRGDARNWSSLAAFHGWPSCGPRWAFYLGAECFRDSLLLAISRALARSCAPGVGVAVLGRRFPVMEDDDVDAQSHGRRLELLGSVRARATWSDQVEVFLYRVAAG